PGLHHNGIEGIADKAFALALPGMLIAAISIIGGESLDPHQAGAQYLVAFGAPSSVPDAPLPLFDGSPLSQRVRILDHRHARFGYDHEHDPELLQLPEV